MMCVLQRCSDARASVCVCMCMCVTHLVWMLDVDAEPQLLQYAALSFDHLVFRVYVVLIKYQWACTPDQ